MLSLVSIPRMEPAPMQVKRVNPNHRRAAEFAETAKRSPNGIIIQFPTIDYPDKDTAKKAARSFQIAFSNMRARERRDAFKLARLMGSDVDENNYQGPYDHLGAFLREQPDCWEVRIREGAVDPIKVIDGETRQPVEKYTPEGQRWQALLDKFIGPALRVQGGKKNFVNPLTEDDIAFAWAYSPEKYRELWMDCLGEEPDAPQKEIAEAGE